jgi:pyruvate/2-oxoacid:ferredoxin oxidoreductase beta subunit
MRLKLKDLPEENIFSSGHTACAGCGAAIAVRNISKVLGKDIIIYVPPSCLSVFNGLFPSCAWTVPYHHTVFENTGAAISGLSRAMKRKGLDNVTVVGIAGDGGTADIGLQALSGAAERNEDVIYICYDNEAYMNTGVQRSGATPHGASTTTTPVGDVEKGNQDFKKDVPLIMMALHSGLRALRARMEIRAVEDRRTGKARGRVRHVVLDGVRERLAQDQPRAQDGESRDLPEDARAVPAYG